VKGWHFAADKLRDGRPLPPKGTRLEHAGECVPCQSGLHFSQRAIDALQYAQGPFVARVEGPDDALPHGKPEDKRCGSWRVNLTEYVDVSRTLHLFACEVAERALLAEIAAGREPDARSWRAIEAKRQWLDGKATDKELAAARDAAWAAAWAAARDAARYAAWAAARDAARAAAWDAAWAAARYAAWAAARDAAWAAARDAAWAAARDAAWDVQNELLERVLTEALESPAQETG
jgi:hypothetical protein